MMNVFANYYLRQELKELVPSSLLSDIAGYVFYDKHPNDKRNIDITVCTKNGELREYFQRDLQSSLNLNCVIKTPVELRILRNNDSEQFYLFSIEDTLFIVSSKEKLHVNKKLINIDRYEVIDTACSGETYLKIIKKDDAVPLIFDSNFECLEERGVILSLQTTEDFPILNELKRKLVEARYSAKCNEKIYAQYLSLHQKVSLLSYQNQQTASNDSIIQDKSKCITGAMNLKIQKPWTKFCNRKLVIILNVLINSKETVENIHILLNNSAITSLVYTTKIFKKVPIPPYWQETNTHTFKLEQECIIAAVIDIEELKQNASSRIKLSGSIAYTISKKEFLISFEDVIISSMQLMGDEFDVLSSCQTSDYNSIIAVLATTEETKLCFRHIKKENEPDKSVLDLFCTHLQMERIENASNVIMYRKSPYHILNGILVVFHERNFGNTMTVSVHTRTTSQVLAMLHCIHDAVPAIIIATIPTNKITAKIDKFSHYNEDITHTTKHLNYMEYALSMLKRSTQILEHLNSSMVQMNQSKNPTVQNKVGTHIDLFAGGVDTFKTFRETLMKEANDAIKFLVKSENVNTEANATLKEQSMDPATKSHSMDENMGSDVMCID